MNEAEFPHGEPAERHTLDPSIRELDRQLFYLKTLNELSREVGGIIQPKKIMEAFLLMAMGTLGFSRGFVLLVHTPTTQVDAVSRGIPPEELTVIEELSPSLSSRFARGRPSAYSSVRIMESDPSFLKEKFPAKTRLVFQWAISGEYCGFLGLGGRLRDEPHHKEDIDFLLNLTGNMVSILGRTISEENIRFLNNQLLRKNEHLEETLKEVQTTKEELDRRVFQLNTLYECNRELLGILDSRVLMDRFLLTAMGTFSVHQAKLVLLDRKAKKVIVSSRGIPPQGEHKPEHFERLIFHCLRLVEQKTVAPMSVRELRDPSSLNSPEFPFLISTALMLIFDEQLMGILAIGEPLMDEEMSGEELELLRAVTTNFMTSLQNARDVEIIRGLNNDLSTSNEQLRQTIADLIAARDRIAFLEGTKERIRRLIDKETERATRFTMFDFVLLLTVSVLIGILFNLSNPNRIPLVPDVLLKTPPPEITFHRTRELVAGESAMLIDARPAQFYDVGRIPGAVNLPPALFDFIYSMRLSAMDPEQTILVYGRTLSKRYDLEVADALRARGHTDVRILEGSFRDWEIKGLPVENGP
jgi:rhodanese-related sulfurtransferase/GAF domain-containing protein